jgi:hypothetical protein
MPDRKKLSRLGVASLLLAAASAPAASAMPVDPVTGNPVKPPAQQDTHAGTVDRAATGNGGDIEWPVAVLGTAGALLVGAGIGATGYRFRIAQARPAH